MQIHADLASGMGNDIEASRGDRALAISALVSSAVPWIGGPVSNVLGGMLTERKIDRVKELLTGLAEDLQNFKSEVSEEYVLTEEFEDLLDQTLRRLTRERSKEKRNLYRGFLRDAVTIPKHDAYDQQIQILQVLEQVTLGHMTILKALAQPPGDPHNMLSGSPMNSLQKRCDNLNREEIQELVGQTNALRLTNLTSLMTMMTATGAEDLRHNITALGRELLQYLSSP